MNPTSPSDVTPGFWDGLLEERLELPEVRPVVFEQGATDMRGHRFLRGLLDGVPLADVEAEAATQASGHEPLGGPDDRGLRQGREPRQPLAPSALVPDAVEAIG